MKELRAKRQIIVAGLEPLEVGSTFTKWPLHITLLPWFRARKQKDLVSAIEQVVHEQRPLIVLLGETALFGKNRDKIVRLAQPEDELRSLHVLLMDAVCDMGAVLEDMSFVSYKYKPHVTVAYEEPVSDTFKIQSVALVSQTPARFKQVDKVFELHE